jgi:hypothetical protein
MEMKIECVRRVCFGEMWMKEGEQSAVHSAGVSLSVLSRSESFCAHGCAQGSDVVCM